MGQRTDILQVGLNAVLVVGLCAALASASLGFVAHAPSAPAADPSVDSLGLDQG